MLALEKCDVTALHGFQSQTFDVSFPVATGFLIKHTNAGVLQHPTWARNPKSGLVCTSLGNALIRFPDYARICQAKMQQFLLFLAVLAAAVQRQRNQTRQPRWIRVQRTQGAKRGREVKPGNETDVEKERGRPPWRKR